MIVIEDRVKTLEDEIRGLKSSIERVLRSTPPSMSKKQKNSITLLDLFGAWDGEIDEFLESFSARRERRGRLE
jgi:hypothetical protein